MATKDWIWDPRLQRFVNRRDPRNRDQAVYVDDSDIPPDILKMFDDARKQRGYDGSTLFDDSPPYRKEFYVSSDYDWHTYANRLFSEPPAPRTREVKRLDAIEHDTITLCSVCGEQLKPRTQAEYEAFRDLGVHLGECWRQLKIEAARTPERRRLPP